MKHPCPFIMFCCNDPRNGNDTGRVGTIEVHVRGDNVLTIEGPIDDNDEDLTPLDFSPHTVSIAGAVYPHKGARSWVGNWCWDGAHMEAGAAIDMLNGLLRSGDWHCTEAETGLFDKWNRGEELTVADIVKPGVPS